MLHPVNKLFSVILLLLFFCWPVCAQRPIDVQHYQYEISLSDLSDVIVGKATIKIKFLAPASTVLLDLVGMKEEKGMKVFQVKEDGKSVKFVHRQDRLEIRPDASAMANQLRTYEIDYMGVPEDGLIISSNKYGERTFFADNWPNRARNWIPCVDDPADKASVEFIVKAPEHYKVVSNGVLLEEKPVEGKLKRTRWKESIPISTKIMVIGAARFTETRVDSNYKVPVTSWVYPQDSAKGNFDYELADDILRYFESLIGDYPYKKLANVQSKTIFEGMENANTIFYAENSVTGTGSSEALIAHEIAHQWFGNTVTEKSFTHLWLSEGFATYMASMYMGHKYGQDSFMMRMVEERDDVIRFVSRSNQPVVDSSSDYMSLLNANSYQKGAWVLHMLREEVGEANFIKILREFYSRYKFSNADTKDFQSVVELVTGKKMNWFFDQWLYQPGIPELKIEMKVDHEGYHLSVRQHKFIYHFPLHIHLIKPDGELIRERFWIDKEHFTFQMKSSGPVKVAIDPQYQLLYKSVD